MEEKPKETHTIIRTEKPNSYEFGPAGQRFKLFFDTPKELYEKIDELKKMGLLKDGE